MANDQVKQLLLGYVVLVSMASAALPFSGYYMKFDWLGALMVSAYGFLFLYKNGISQFATRYCFVFVSYLFLNGLVASILHVGGLSVDGYVSYLFQYLLALLVFISVLSFRLDTDRVIRLMYGWVAVGCAASALAIAQVTFDSLIVDRFLFIPYYEDSAISQKIVGGIFAPTAWFSEASWFGSFLVVPTMFVAFRVLGGGQDNRSRRVDLSALFLLLTGVLLSYSLTAALSVAIGLCAMTLVARRFTLLIPFLLIPTSASVIVFSEAPLVALQVQRFSELVNNLLDFQPGSVAYGTATSLYVRSIGFAAGIDVFFQNPVMGNGLGQSDSAYHSGFITLIAELGVSGAVLYFLLPLFAVRRLLRISQHRGGEVRVLAQTLVVCLVSDYANGLITHHSFHLQRWLLISIVCSWILYLRGAPGGRIKGCAKKEATYLAAE